MYGNENRYCFPYTLAVTDHVGLYAYWWYDDSERKTALATAKEALELAVETEKPAARQSRQRGGVTHRYF